MRFAIRMAKKGRGTVRPNPLVGAVIVRGGRVIAVGHHQRAGEAHAEVAALADLARRTGSLEAARGATLYVTLEPCCHQGRTGPCTEVIKTAGFARVVIGTRDPNPRVDGRGGRVLRKAGIALDEGCLPDECRELNRGFFTWIRLGRPFVTLKLAATLDGFLADGRQRPRRAPAWITGPEARNEVHVLRAVHDAILVGAGTVAADDPLLTVRGPAAASKAPTSSSVLASSVPAPFPPLRVVVDGKLSVQPTARIFGGGSLSVAPLVVTSRAALLAPAHRRKLASLRSRAEVVAIAGRDGRLPWKKVLELLGAREVQSLLVEGGADVAGGLIAAGLVDRVVLFFGPKLIGHGVPMARGPGRPLGQALTLGPATIKPIGPDWVLVADILGAPVAASRRRATPSRKKRLPSGR